MFAYCENKPVNCKDPLGKWTMGISIGANLTILLGVSISIGLYWDDNGNVDWQWSYSVPGLDDTVNVGLVDVGASVAYQYTNADTVYDLYGSATYLGASGGPLWYVGGDYITSGNIDGFQLVGGIGLGFDMHLTETYTKPVGKQDTKPVGKQDTKPVGRQDTNSSTDSAVVQSKWYYYYHNSLW